jgi:hypothetical protein
VKLPVCFIKYHATKAYGSVKVQLHSFLTSALDVSGELQDPIALPPRKQRQWKGGWLGLIAGVKVVEKTVLCQEWNPDSSVMEPLT